MDGRVFLKEEYVLGRIEAFKRDNKAITFPHHFVFFTLRYKERRLMVQISHASSETIIIILLVLSSLASLFKENKRKESVKLKSVP